MTYVQSEKRNTGCFDTAKFKFPLYLMTKPCLLYKNKQIIVWENAQNALRNALHKIPLTTYTNAKNIVEVFEKVC